MKETPTPLRCESLDQWSEWLLKNGRAEKEVWLSIKKKHSTQEGIDLSTAVEEAICYGWIDGKLRSVDADSFMLHFTPRKPNSVWSKINRDRAMKLMKEGRMEASGLATIKDAKASGWWSRPATNLTRDRIPADLRRALLAEDPAWDHFQRLSNSHRNRFIAWVTSAKLSETRKNRVQRVVSMALKNEKPSP